MPPIWVDDFDGPANATDDPSLPATMLVDWIRVNSPRLRVGDAAHHERSGPA